MFPRAGEKGKKKNEAITNKSELLFVWLMLDLLRPGGRCAVIMPEGVLFGNTDAHVRLRRELMTDHAIEAVISLPPGVFQPYTGVKTSILVFRKETPRDAKTSLKTNASPRTQAVWFYEINDDGYSLDAKRTPQAGRNNDMWDAINQFKIWQAKSQEDRESYFQPHYHSERWRVVDDALVAQYLSEPEVEAWNGKIAAVHELFPDLGAQGVSPRAMEELVSAKHESRLKALIAHSLDQSTQAAWEAANKMTFPEERRAAAEKLLSKGYPAVRRLMNAQKELFNNDEPLAWKLFQRDFGKALERIQEEVLFTCEAGEQPSRATVNLKAYSEEEARAIALEYAKLDGFDVVLRSVTVDKQARVKPTKCWVVPVRVWVHNDAWTSEDGRLRGSHTSNGQVRPEYIAAMEGTGIYDGPTLRPGILDPDCIEAREWSLSAGQYKPFDFAQLRSNKTVSELIIELRGNEQKIIVGLDKLLAMVEGRE